jgi:hypothetical protein
VDDVHFFRWLRLGQLAEEVKAGVLRREWQGRASGVSGGGKAAAIHVTVTAFQLVVWWFGSFGGSF